MINALFLLVAVGAIAAEAVRRLLDPAPAAGADDDLGRGASAIVVNLAHRLAVRARAGKGTSTSAPPICTWPPTPRCRRRWCSPGFVILWTGQRWVDPVMSLAVAGVILWGSIGLLRESVGMSLTGVPRGIVLDEVEAALARAGRGRGGPRPPRLGAEHDRDRAHRAPRRARVGSTDELLRRALAMLHDRFEIEHCTIQIEREQIGDAHC